MTSISGRPASTSWNCGPASSSAVVRSIGMTTPAASPASSRSAAFHRETATASASSGTPSSFRAATLIFGYGLSGITQWSSAVR
ncbi:hypothetical protein [Amycolatopsis sp. H20-H5]|uniref:hypothetical protein n=1 Tax=Amycolatopsis sp. H20-H5 TaxID=3046309 RepID=UPI002DBB68A3|nr:hypothetical protein [Amycolatopsis sp. H20-H5]MEC3979681.1 hypothetical protein [Amycolatopsis sp. H20-H5]